MKGGYIPSSYSADILDDLMTGLILELSDLSTLLPYGYISRHTHGKTPLDHLAPFLARFHEFVDHFGKDETYTLPTVWLVGHFQNQESITRVRQKLEEKSVKYFDDGEEYDSYDQFNQSYWDEKSDAERFVKFIHQTTLIGIDLLRTVDYKQKLDQLGRLQWMRYTAPEDVKSDLKEMERYLWASSPFYRDHIADNPSEYKEFWQNFTKIKATPQPNGQELLGSWPHFLFNICGI